MIDIDKLTIGEVKQLQALLGGNTPRPTPVNCGVRIVILQRGWVCVGNYVQCGPSESRLDNASVIRLWGTTKGLGELAVSGPTKDTKLDKAGVVRFHPLAEVASLDCDAKKWESHVA